MMDEETVVAKVEEIMRILDDVKKYNALARALKTFVGIIFFSFLVLVGLVVGLDLANLINSMDHGLFLILSFGLLLIPISGLAAGVLYIKRKVNTASTEEWKEELSNGFPSALKLLMELDWERTVDEIAIGKLTYLLYGLLKTGVYFFVTLFALEIVGNMLLVLLVGNIDVVSALFFGLLTFPVVYMLVGNDLLRRYKEIHTLDMLLLDLRWFSKEVGRYEF
jgi:F0F1-type ATP synthase assembly protein I